MTWLSTILGVAVVAVGLNDLFHTLLHPSGRGRLSLVVVTAVWRVSRRLKHKPGSLSGPLAIVVVIAVWASLQIVGWALIYYPHFPQGFSYSSGVYEERYSDFAEAVYFSIVTLATLGYGDVVPIDNWLRLVAPLQSVMGFALLTGAVSWFMQIYPALARRRALALRLTLLKKADYAAKLADVDVAIGTQLFESLAIDITQVRVDLTQNSETYYFRETDSDSALPASISYAFDLYEKSRQSQRPDIRLGGEVMKAALNDLASLLTSKFARKGDAPREVFESFASDHGHADVSEP